MFEGLVTIPAVKRKKKTERFYKKRNKRFLENAAKRGKRIAEAKYDFSDIITETKPYVSWIEGSPYVWEGK